MTTDRFRRTLKTVGTAAILPLLAALSPWLVLPASAQEPPSIKLPPLHQTRARAAEPAKSGGLDPVALYRSRSEAAAAAFQSAYRAATVERNRWRAIRLFLVSLRRQPHNPAALFNTGILCAMEGRWEDAQAFLKESARLAEPDSESARAAAAELPRAEAVGQLQGTPEGRRRREYDQALMAAVGKSKDPFVGLAAAAQLAAADKTRWEAAALAGILRAQTGQFAESVRELRTAAGLAPAERGQSLGQAAEIASREASYLELARSADGLWESRNWEGAAKAYERAWEKSQRHADTALLAVNGYLLADQTAPAVALLARLKEVEPATGAKVAAMLKALAEVSPDAARAAESTAAAVREPEPEPPARIRQLVGPLTTPAMELTARPHPPLLADRTEVIPLSDSELDSGENSMALLSTESVFQLYRSALPAQPPAPSAETPPPAGIAASTPPPAAAAPEAAVDGVSIQTEPAGALVVVDDSTPCTAPCLIPLPPGRHSLRAQLARYRPALRIFEVPRNAAPPAVRVNLDAKVGFVMVDSTPPGAAVTVDGRATGSRTPARMELKEGEHEVTVELDGKPRNTKVTVADGALVSVRF
jgi:hypothetical protein